MQQVLHVSPVPVDVDTRHGSSASVGQSASEGQATSNRKRQEDVKAASEAQTSGQQPEQATASGVENAEKVKKVEAEGTSGTDAPDQAQWGLRHAAELGEVVRWCEPRIAWELLRLQLKVSQLSH